MVSEHAKTSAITQKVKLKRGWSKPTIKCVIIGFEICTSKQKEKYKNT